MDTTRAAMTQEVMEQELARLQRLVDAQRLALKRRPPVAKPTITWRLK